MNRYPEPCSVLMMDNCAIHKSEVLRELVEDAGMKHHDSYSNGNADAHDRLPFALPSTLFS